MKKILYATDYSENSLTALDYAWNFKNATGAELILFHSYGIPSIMSARDELPTFPDITKDAVELNIRKLRELFESRAGKNASKEGVRYEARESTAPSRGILEIINDVKPDLVIVGTRGENRLRDMILGSTSRTLIEKSNSPVLCIPTMAAYRKPERILYASDFDNGDIKAIWLLSKIARAFETSISIMHVSKSGEKGIEEELNTFKNDLEKVNLKVPLDFVMPVSNDIFDSLKDYIAESKVDLLVMLEREKDSLINRWFHRDLVKRMELQTNIPILSYNESALHEMSLSEEKTVEIE